MIKNGAGLTSSTHHQEIAGFIWNIADKLRGPYRPPQYRRVMLPLIVLKRLDAVLETTKDAVLVAKGFTKNKNFQIKESK